MSVPLLRTGRVAQILARRARATWLLVDVGGEPEKAICYEDWSGPVALGDRVLLNVAAARIGLGTGGHHFVVANLECLERDSPAEARGMKARYTPAQIPVLPVEEDPRYRSRITGFRSLREMPVALAFVHSHIGALAVAIRSLAGPSLKLAVVLTDSAALPAALSDLLANLRDNGFVDSVITTGQAFGGDYEAVNLYTGLIAATEVVGAQVTLLGAGPGHLGTGTRFGFSCVDLGAAARAAFVLGGRPILVPRVGYADPRPRHRGLSHHTLTLLRDIIADRLTVALPTLSGGERDLLQKQVADEKLTARHDIVYRDGAFIEPALRDCGFPVLHMGRSFEEDPVFFQAAGAAARFALELTGAFPPQPLGAASAGE